MDKKKEGTIMVVDDDPAVLEVTSLLLSERGYRTISFGRAGDAIESLKNGRVDLVLSDISMPSVSGIELLEKVHEIDPQMPVILMTGYTDFDTAVDAVKMRAFDFILKPLRPEHLYRSVEKALIYVRLLRTEKDYKRLLEKFNREIEALVAERTTNLLALTIADKIRNPATVIGLSCKKILEGRDDPRRMQDHIRTVVSEAEKLDTIVQKFQAFLEKRRSLFEYEDINIIAQSAVSITQSEAEDKGLELVAALSGRPLKINMEKNLMRVALCHVIRNAISATPGGGTVTLQTCEELNAAVITVSDTGCGIPDEDICLIFDPFFSTKEYSFGMGLPLVRQIVSEHMGEIAVESVQGKGTTFRIKLPLRWSGKNLEVPNYAPDIVRDSGRLKE